MKIKVCGMRDRQNIAELVALPVDYIGFIFYAKSQRFVGNSFSVSDMGIIPPSIKKTGVFVNAPMEYVEEKIDRCKLDCVQLHGAETPEYCQYFKSKGIVTVKAFGVDESFDFTSMDAYTDYCDFFLFDTRTPTHGGTGLKFDWTILNNYKLDKPFFLSGGITVDDIPAIQRLSHLPIHGLDINSKFELHPAMKDIDLIEGFIGKI